MKGKKMEFKRIANYDIKIRHTANGGIIAKVGCAEFSFSNPDDFLKALTEYYENPDLFEKQYNEVAMGDAPQEVATSNRQVLRGPSIGEGRGIGSGPYNEEASDRPVRSSDIDRL